MPKLNQSKRADDEKCLDDWIMPDDRIEWMALFVLSDVGELHEWTKPNDVDWLMTLQNHPHLLYHKPALHSMKNLHAQENLMLYFTPEPPL